MVALASMAHFISNSRVWNDWSFLQEKAGLLILAKATDDWPLMVSRRSFTSLLYRIESKVAKTSVVPEISRSSPLNRLLRLHLPFGEKAWCGETASCAFIYRLVVFTINDRYLELRPLTSSRYFCPLVHVQRSARAERITNQCCQIALKKSAKFC